MALEVAVSHNSSNFFLFIFSIASTKLISGESKDFEDAGETIDAVDEDLEDEEETN